MKELFELTRGPEKLRPYIVGETGGGKTAKVKQIAKELGMPLKTLLLSQSPPEDILGIPKQIEGDNYVMSTPSWVKKAVETPYIIFLDEIDKAREETKAAVLTLLWSLEVQDNVLHKDTIIVCAGQPEDAEMFLSNETGKALAARSIFIHNDYDWAYLENKHGISLSLLPTPPSKPMPINPYPSPRQVDLALQLLSRTANDETRMMIVNGIFQPELHESILSPEGRTISVESVVNVLNKDPMYVLDLSVAELADALPEIVLKGDPEVFSRALAKIRIETTTESFSDVMSNLHSTLSNVDVDSADNRDDSLEDALNTACRCAAFAGLRNVKTYEELLDIFEKENIDIETYEIQ